jgi:acyl dehydratase
MAYAAAVGGSDPCYFDTTAPAGPTAHPLFAVCHEWPVLLALREQAIGVAVARLGVHASHHLVVHRPPKAGETVRTAALVTDVIPRRSGTLVLVRLTTVDGEGAPVTTTDYGTLFRGVATGDGFSPVASLPSPAPPAMGEVRWNEALDIPAHAAHVYTECARIWNPIHTDIAAARAAGLPGLILHGTATLALVVSRIVTRDFGRDPASVREIVARFTGMVSLPSRLAIRVRSCQGGGVGFDVEAIDGAPVISHGVVR